MTLKPQLIQFPSIKEPKGDLTFTTFESDLPFEVKRSYWITEIPDQQLRGGHAHKSDIQLIVCVKGRVKAKLQALDGDVHEFTLSSASEGLLIPPMWWGEMVFSEDALLLGFASNPFNEKDYIRDKADFR